MAKSVDTKLISILLLAIILPIGVLLVLKFAGIFGVTYNPEVLTMSPISWDMERPFYFLNVDQTVENDYSDNSILATVSLWVTTYYEYGAGHSPDSDSLAFRIKVNVTASQGSVSSLNFTAKPTDDNSSVLIDTTNDFGLKYANISVSEKESYGTRNDECYLSAKVLQSPCYLQTQGEWIMDDYNTQSHELVSSLTIVHHNGTSYRKLVFPINLTTWVDAGNEFETAKPINIGKCFGSLSWRVDTADYFTAFVETGQTIRLEMTLYGEIHSTEYQLSLYDPMRNLRTGFLQSKSTKSVTFDADSTGSWYISVNCTYPVDILYSIDLSLSA
jgi:hypothetical protein